MSLVNRVDVACYVSLATLRMLPQPRSLRVAARALLCSVFWNTPPPSTIFPGPSDLLEGPRLSSTKLNRSFLLSRTFCSNSVNSVRFFHDPHPYRLQPLSCHIRIP